MRAAQPRVEARETRDEEPGRRSPRHEGRHEQHVAPGRTHAPHRIGETVGEFVGIGAPTHEVVGADEHGDEVGAEASRLRQLRRDGVVDPATADGQVGVADLLGRTGSCGRQHREAVSPSAVLPSGTREASHRPSVSESPTAT